MTVAFSGPRRDLTATPINISNTHMLSLQTARAFSKTICVRSSFQLPCLIHRLEISGPLTTHISPSRSSSSSTRWKSRQGRDSYAREAKVQGLKSRAAFKLLEVCIVAKCQNWEKTAVTNPKGRLIPSTGFSRRDRRLSISYVSLSLSLKPVRLL
jgi:hypothetical protein